VLLDEFTAAGEEVELKEKEGLGSTMRAISAMRYRPGTLISKSARTI
jgi:hypothetical protein